MSFLEKGKELARKIHLLPNQGLIVSDQKIVEEQSEGRGEEELLYGAVAHVLNKIHQGGFYYDVDEGSKFDVVAGRWYEAHLKNNHDRSIQVMLCKYHYNAK